MTMANEYRKKLIEVAIPLEVINKAAVREKSIRHGHPSTLHLWWARRPLATCRAILFAQLVDDPSSHPDKFSTVKAQEKERERLFKIIEELVVWKNSTNEEVLERARAEIRISCGDDLPPVYDPFSGGCSIPLEAQRLGLPAFGSDLNPVAVMIGKAMIEIPQSFKDQPPIHPGIKDSSFYRNAEGLAEDVRYYGQWMREKAFERIGHLYPDVELPAEYGSGKVQVIAWIWTRTVPSPDPAFSGVHVPIASSFALSTKKGKEAWVEPIVDRVAKTINFRIQMGGTNADIDNAKEGTKSGRGANFRCLLSNTAITPDYVKAKGRAGEIGQTLIAIVGKGRGGRAYVGPSTEHENIAFSAKPSWKPEQRQPENPRWFSPPAYGMETFGDLFTDRQLVVLNTLSDLVQEVQMQCEKDALTESASDDLTPLREGGQGAKAYAEAVAFYLGLCVSRQANRSSTICFWDQKGENVQQVFARQAIPMTWDFVEGNPFSSSTGNFVGQVSYLTKVIDNFSPNASGSERQQDAQSIKIPNNAVISTDPPYYDNIGYADLSDFFYVWIRNSIKDIFPDELSTLMTPKASELVATPYRHNNRLEAEAFFLEGMTEAISNMARQTSDQYPATIYYAFKQGEVNDDGVSSTGWATFLEAILTAGYTIVGTWPTRTELTGNLKKKMNVLATSVVLVCRKRNITAEIVTRAEFIRALKRELPPALHELQKANITPVDIPQASIGPGIGVFSRYKTVLENDDSAMRVKTALQIINSELDAFFTAQEGEFDADTRFSITWFEQNGMKAGDFGDADNLARARGLSVDSVKHAGIVESTAGQVRLLARDELEADWSPANDTHLTIWECTQYLIRALQDEGEYSAAVLLKQMGPENADAARDLAYRLFDICNKQAQSKEAGAYNSLIAVWSDLTARSATISDAEQGQEQLGMI
jgi:putative DNA methylase